MLIWVIAAVRASQLTMSQQAFTSPTGGPDGGAFTHPHLHHGDGAPGWPRSRWCVHAGAVSGESPGMRRSVGRVDPETL